MSLQDEITWFDSNRAFIAKQYQGQFVLIKDQSVRGAYPTYQAAYLAGAQMFGPQPFLIKEALTVDRVNRI